MARRIRISLEGVKSVTIDYLEDDEPAAESGGSVDADVTLANTESSWFGFTPFSTGNPFGPDEE